MTRIRAIVVLLVVVILTAMITTDSRAAVVRACDLKLSQFDRETNQINWLVVCAGSGFEKLGVNSIDKFDLFEDGSFALDVCLEWGQCNETVFVPGQVRGYLPVITASRASESDGICKVTVRASDVMDSYTVNAVRMDCPDDGIVKSANGNGWQFEIPKFEESFQFELADFDLQAGVGDPNSGIAQFRGCLPGGLCSYP